MDFGSVTKKKTGKKSAKKGSGKKTTEPKALIQMSVLEEIQPEI